MYKAWYHAHSVRVVRIRSVFSVPSPVKRLALWGAFHPRHIHHETAPLPTPDRQHHVADHVHYWGQPAAQWHDDREPNVCSRIRQRWHETGSTQHLLQCHSTGCWPFIAHDLFVLPSPRPRLVVSHQFDNKNCIAWGMSGATTNSTQLHN